MAVSISKVLEIASTINTPIVIDDHTGEKIDIAAVCVLSIGNERHHVVALLPSTSHCLNALNNKGGVWRQTTCSVSGMVDTRQGTIETAINSFNDSYSEGDLSGDIHRLTLVKVF